MKKIIIGATALCIIIVSCFFIFRENPKEENVRNFMDGVDSYHIEGNMEIMNGEQLRSYAIEVDYALQDEESFFKVSITDKELNQTQNILRNKEGVFVITPTLNQIFKFEGDWPLNSLKPYLLQSIHEITNSDKATISSNKDEVFVSSEVNYPNNKNYRTQEMYFDQDGKIKQLQILDDSDTTQLSIVFTIVEFNTKLDESTFEVPTSLKSEVRASTVSEMDLPLYPMQIFDSTLDTTSTLDNNGVMQHVLTYTGDRNFTLIQSVVSIEEETQTVIMSGDFIDNLTNFGFYNGNNLTMVKDQIEYTIYSDELSVDEMVEVLNSIQVVVMK